MKSSLFLPLYASILVVALIIIIFFVDKETPKTVFVFLLLMYIGLLLFYWRQYKSQGLNKKIPSLNDFKNNIKHTTLLSRFQSQCQSVLQQINMQNKQQNNQNNYYSPYSYTARYPVSLKQLPTPINQYQQQSNIFGTYNIQIWRQQFRQASEQFKQNLNIPIKNRDAYQNLLIKLNLNIQKLTQAQQIIQSFLKDRSILYCTQTIKIVNEINKLLSRNFGLNLTKVQIANTKQINMQQLTKLLNFYSQNHTLPSEYKKISINSPSQTFNSQIGINVNININIQRNSTNKLDYDIQQIISYFRLLQPMKFYPSQRFNPCLLIYLLRTQFPNQKIQINKQNSNNLTIRQNNNNIFNSFMLNKQNFIYNFLVQIDNWISLSFVPQFRTKNCMKICLIFLLVLLKKQNNTGHPMLRSLKKLLK